MIPFKNSSLRGLAALVASIPIALSTASCERGPRLDYSQNPPLERKVDPKEQVANELNARLRRWQSHPSYEVAKKWLVGYTAPEFPNRYAYFEVRENGSLGKSVVKITDLGDIRDKYVIIELEYGYARDVLAESARLEAQRYLNTGNFGGFP